ncbi:hypothetical protein HER11_07615 [Fervidobacterium pennivorans subsp. keratinolyticus]|nr:hypothetical protein HER11_07615 [Fervidobacterium pennivorans subsp. keratinolyticus]
MRAIVKKLTEKAKLSTYKTSKTHFAIFTLLVLLIFYNTLFGIVIEKVYVGIKYSFRNYRTNGDVIFIDPFGKKMALYELSSKQILDFYNYIGNFVIAVYDLKDSYIIVDRTGPYLSKMALSGELLSTVKFDRRIQASIFDGEKIYILLESGAAYTFDKNLKQLSVANFTGSPAYMFLWKGRLLGTYLWNDNYDVEFLGEKPLKIGLTTPSILVNDLLVDTRGGKVYNLATGKITKLASYISSAYYDKDSGNYYICSMSNSTVYVIKDDTVVNSFQVPFTPTQVSKIGNFIVVLSAPYNKVMVTTNGKDFTVLDTGDYPLEIFKIGNSNTSFAVYCSDSGEVYYYYF